VFRILKKYLLIQDRNDMETYTEQLNKHEGSLMKRPFTIDNFTALTLRLNYLLSVKPIDWRGILTCMFEDQLPDDVEDHLLETLHYLEAAYGEKKRKVGTPAIMHPLRSASILSRACETSNILDVLTTLLHDKDEDLLSDNYPVEKWNMLEKSFRSLAGKIESRDKWFLNERVHFLAKEREETYQEYLSRLVHQAAKTQELIRIKLADRLDNTLDLRTNFHDPIVDINFYQFMFELLFDRSYKGLNIYGNHPTTNKILGSRRLNELFKNFTLFSLLTSGNIKLDEPSQWLLNSIVDASIREAQNVILHIFEYHLREPKEQREVVRGVLDLSVSDDKYSDNRALEVFIKNIFEHENGSDRHQRLDELYENKERMAQAAVAFVVLFGSYLGN